MEAGGGVGPGEARDLEALLEDLRGLIVRHHHPAVGPGDDHARGQLPEHGLEQRPLAAELGDETLALGLGAEVLDRDRRHLRELDQDRLVLGGEGMVLAAHELDRAQRPPVAGEERRGEDGSVRRRRADPRDRPDGRLALSHVADRRDGAGGADDLPRTSRQEREELVQGPRRR